MLQIDTDFEQAFRQLNSQQRADIIYHGAVLRLSELKNRRFLAESKLREFETKYGQSLSQLETIGLPDDASLEMHEDYILWCHWDQEVHAAASELRTLEPLVNQPFPLSDSSHARR